MTQIFLAGFFTLWSVAAMAGAEEAEQLVRDNAQKVLQILSENKDKVKDRSWRKQCNHHSDRQNQGSCAQH